VSGRPSGSHLGLFPLTESIRASADIRKYPENTRVPSFKLKSRYMPAALKQPAKLQPGRSCKCILCGLTHTHFNFA
jgi:hypothetical protein